MQHATPRASSLAALVSLSALFALSGCATQEIASDPQGDEPMEFAFDPPEEFTAPVAGETNDAPFDPFAPNETPYPNSDGSFTPPTYIEPEALTLSELLNGFSPDKPTGADPNAPFDGAENLSQISFTAVGSDFDPDISADGRVVVFASTQHRPTADVYMKGITGRTITQLTSDPANDVMPAISPDGSRIAFASDRNGSWDIYIMNVEGGHAVQVTGESSHEMHPTWSPDGRYLSYCRLNPTTAQWELWVTESLNTGVRQFLGYGIFPEWSPVNNKILFQRPRERGDRLFSVWTIDYINGEGVNPTEVISSPFAAVVNPSWSPDGARIVFATIRNDDPSQNGGSRPYQSDLWIIDALGASRANLTGGRHVNLMPAWSPDGRIYFVSDRSGVDNIWSLAPDKAIIAASGPQPGGGRRVADAPDN